MDSASPQVSGRILRLFGENRVIAVVFPDIASNTVQALDLTFSGALEKSTATAVGECGDESVNEQITRLAQA
jgi:hypothetical protein